MNVNKSYQASTHTGGTSRDSRQLTRKNSKKITFQDPLASKSSA